MTSAPTSDAASIADLGAAVEAKAGPAIIPGELRSWCSELTDLLDELRPDAERAFDREARTLLAIADQDPELQARVDALDERLAGARRTLGELGERVSRLRDDAEPEVDSSSEPTDEGERLREALLRWATEARALEGEIVTWTQESVNRDRGVAD